MLTCVRDHDAVLGKRARWHLNHPPAEASDGMQRFGNPHQVADRSFGLDVEDHLVISLQVARDDHARSADLVMPADDLLDLHGMNEHAPNLGRLVCAPHPAFYASIGPAAGADAVT